MKNMLDKFYNFTVHDNSGFHIAYGDIVISVCAHNYLDSFSAMEGNGRCGDKARDFNLMPKDIPFFTFNNAEVCIFNQKTDEKLNKKIIRPDADDYEEYINPEMLIDILIKARDYAKEISR